MAAASHGDPGQPEQPETPGQGSRGSRLWSGRAAVQQEVDVLVELQAHLLQLLLDELRLLLRAVDLLLLRAVDRLRLRARAVGLDLALHLRLVVAHHAQQPRAVLREHLHAQRAAEHSERWRQELGAPPLA